MRGTNASASREWLSEPIEQLVLGKSAIDKQVKGGVVQQRRNIVQERAGEIQGIIWKCTERD